MKQNIAPAVFTALILLLCLIPSAGMLLPEEDGGPGANESLAALPALRTETGFNPACLSQLRDYLEDHFFLRQDLITAWSRLNVRFLGSSITGDVVLGRDGWLYFGGTLPDYAGTDPLSDREVQAAARDLALMRDCAAGQGAAFLFTIAPNKNSLYPEHMPALTASAAPGNAERLAAALEEAQVPYLDLFARFREQGETLYFPRDSHWNSQGAALAADALNQALGRQSDYFEGPFQPTPNHKGDLYDMLYPAGEAMETDLAYQPGLAFEYDAPIRSAENLTIRTHGGGEGSLLLFRDSFGNLLYPYLADSFGAALFSRSMPYRLDLLAQREADFLVVELVERNLRYLLQNVPVMPAPRRDAPENLSPLAQTASARWEAADSLPGWRLLTGVLPVPADPGSPVLAGAGGTYYEAFVLEDGGFGCYLPEDTLPVGAAFQSGGGFVWTAFALETPE